MADSEDEFIPPIAKKQKKLKTAKSDAKQIGSGRIYGTSILKEGGAPEVGGGPDAATWAQIRSRGRTGCSHIAHKIHACTAAPRSYS